MRLVALLGVLMSTPSMSSNITPLFDGHIHYNRDVWTMYTPKAALAKLDEAGIGRALVSSTPDEGTLKLFRLAPERIIPVLRPYRTPTDRGSWYRDSELIEYIKQHLKPSVHRGIGEFHLYGKQANTPQIKRLVELAVAHDLFLHSHSDESATETLVAYDPRVRVLWAHGGMTSSPEAIDSILSRHPNIWVELSYRYDDILSTDELESAWRELFLKYPDRFILGTDTWTAERWVDAPYITRTARHLITLLPEGLEEKFAYKNADQFLKP